MAPVVPAKRSRPMSKLAEEEAAFPRGGASTLTPLEHKQIAIEATRDVLFEQSHGGKSSKQDADGEEESRPRKKLKSKDGKGKKKKGSEVAAPEEHIKIEGLNYKRIVPGSMVLGLVSQINHHDIALSLPNNLTGYVPITSISDKITEKIEAIAEAEAKSEDGEDEDGNDIELDKLFKIGQYLRAFVVSTSDEPTAGSSDKPKRRIELSLRPQQANHAIKAQNVIVHNTLMASVASVEDHGLVMDLGLLDQDMKGFMSSKEIGNGVKVSDVQEGAVYLCTVTGLSSNGKIVKLSADIAKTANLKKLNYISDAPTIDAFQPGTAVEILVADISPRGIIGKVMGMLDVTADLMHSGAGARGKDMEKKYKIGSKIKARVICTFPTSDPPKIGVSLLDHVLSFSPQLAKVHDKLKDPLDVLPLSTIIEELTVQKVEPEVGLFVGLGIKGVAGFVHISRVKDGKIESLSTTGTYKVGSTHRGRLIGYNSLDGVYLVSLEESVLEQPYLRIEDLKVGEIAKGKIEKIVVNAKGVGGVLVNLAEGISGLVPEMHLADVQLLHPEKLFKPGKTVTVRVLSTDPSKRQIRLTLKKSLVNSEAAPFISYDDIKVGMQSPGAIINLLQVGAVVQFYGHVRGFLPVGEMSEAYIQDPSQHFKIGQVVNVHVLKVDAEAKKLVVTCKDPAAFGIVHQKALKDLKVGEIVSANVTEKTTEGISVTLEGSGLASTLPVAQLTDKSDSRNQSAWKKIRVGQVLTDLAVLEKQEQNRLVILTNKPSLVKAAKDRTLLRSFEDVKGGKQVHGFVRDITLTAVFVQFGGGLTGLLPKTKLSEAAKSIPDFGLKKGQSIELKIISSDQSTKRFVLAMEGAEPTEKADTPLTYSNEAAVEPIDEEITFVDDLTLGKLTKAKVVSVKDTQINVKLANNIQGRIDVSQLFDTWEEIKNRKRPLQKFTRDQIIPVRVLGIHDARNHRFLPISHRSGKTLVYELSAKTSDQTHAKQEPLTLAKVKIGSSHIAFVNNIGDRSVWVNLSPNVRGRIATLDLSDDVSLLQDVGGNFPVGSAIKVRVTNVDVASNRLDLSARSTQASEVLTFEKATRGKIVPGKITRVSERQLMVQLSPNLSGPVSLTDLSDDFSTADTSKYTKNDVVRVCVVDQDVPNKRLRLSTRRSRVLDSSAKVEDPEISSISQIKPNDVVRGFVNNIAEKGLYVNLGGNVRAFVGVANLSDAFIKDWKSYFQVDQLVKGKILAANEANNFIQMSLKESVLDRNFTPPVMFESIKEGDIIEGKIRKVEDFGVFIVISNSKNVSGLCHQSEMAEKRVHEVKKLYEEGDLVKAKVLKIDKEMKRLSFGMKASYIDPGEGNESEEESDDEDGTEGVKLAGSDDEVEDSEDEEQGGMDLDDAESDDDMSDAEENVPGLDAGGFDWTASMLNQDDKAIAASSDDEAPSKPKKKRKKAEVTEDRTGDLDVNGPQSVSDFERLLLGQPDSADLWIRYIAFQLQLGEVEKARTVAERAIKTINIRDDSAKKAVWIALLNLEVEYGSEDTVQEAFTKACQYSDNQEMHENIASIYIRSGKYSQANDLFQTLVKKFSKDPRVWENYASFLFTSYSRPDDARLLLPRALQILPEQTLPLTIKFAAMEFKSRSGSPERGRTMFEGVLSQWPKRIDLWNQLVDLEVGQKDAEIVRATFERALKVKGLKDRNAQAFLGRWLKWEEEHGDNKLLAKVQAIKEEWDNKEKARKGK
ncbi:hypothetical protein BJ878DRAFT_553142 [Calycina marina]|uniref:rRNA biogenesis protein RRP5 n=1 Tax=Calycina marina TaxID=1763456 RepID=A0A9P7Z138_9HELO|nr:hypothetical protein BJ878DRAFT_553142 [Calycina marina]